MTSSHSETELALPSDGPARLLAGGTAFEQRLLRAAQSEPVPDAALERLARSWNAPLEPAASAVPAGAGAAKGLTRWITAGVLGGIALVAPLLASHWRAGDSTEQHGVPQEPALQARLNPAPDLLPLTVTDAPAQHTAPETASPGPVTPETVTPEPPATPAARRPRRPQRALPPPTATAEKAPQPDRSLRAELHALEGIQQKLAAGHAADAARALDEYHAQFPCGELELEAELLSVDVALGTGQKQLARQRASALLARGEGARYRDRLNALLKNANGRIETSAAPHERAEVVTP